MPTRPAVVALVRGVLEAAVLAGLGALTVWLTSADLGQLAPWSPVALLALRQIEGLADERIDPSVQRGPLGGKPTV